MTSTSPAKDYKAPGVELIESPAVYASMAALPTAVPIFIGYTATAIDPSSGKQLYLQPVLINSLADYETCFGAGYASRHVVGAVPASAPYDFQAGTLSVANGQLKPDAGAHFCVTGANGAAGRFNLYAAMRLFYANGGGACYVVSVNNYWGVPSLAAPAGRDAAPAPITLADLGKGLAVAGATDGPTIIVIPDACLLPADGKGQYSDYGRLSTDMMGQASTLGDRVALLDLPAALDPAAWANMDAQVNSFYEAIADAHGSFSYGVVYGPALRSTLLSASDLNYTRLGGTTDSVALMNNLLTALAWQHYPPGAAAPDPRFTDLAAHIGAAFAVPGAAPFGAPAGVIGTLADSKGVLRPVSLVNEAACKTPANDAEVQALDQYLVQALPLLNQIKQILADQLNVAAPSGALAGIWARNDAERGVWNAPANLTLADISVPVLDLTDKQQSDYNLPMNGNSLCVLRTIPDRGTVVWGARTLDGNSIDYRYVQVRRTLVYIEQSIKRGLRQYAFAANNGGTWAAVTASVSAFLIQLWQAGGLMGDKASDAFTVNCGVPTSMSGLDVLNGDMIVNVTVQLIHPALFIELTFKQVMQAP